MAIKMILTGPRTGQTCKLNKGAYTFVKGELVLEGTFDQLEGVVKYLGRAYRAFPEGSPQLKQAQEAYRGPSQNQSTTAGRPDEQVGGGVQPSGGEPAQVPAEDSGGHDDAQVVPTGGSSERDGHTDAGDDGPSERTERILTALNDFDHNDDEMWTAHGTARIEAIEKATGLTGVSRAEVEAAAPDFIRSQPHT